MVKIALFLALLAQPQQPAQPQPKPRAAIIPASATFELPQAPPTKPTRPSLDFDEGRLNVIPKKPRAAADIAADIRAVEALLEKVPDSSAVKILATHKLAARHLELAEAQERGIDSGRRARAAASRQRAVEILTRGLEGPGDTSELRYALAVAYERQGHDAMAIEAYRALLTTPLEGAAQVAIGDLSFERDLDGAGRSYKHAITKLHSDKLGCYARYRLAHVLWRENNAAAAAKRFREATRCAVKFQDSAAIARASERDRPN